MKPGMVITDIVVFLMKVKKGRNHLATVKVVLNDHLLVGGIRILKSKTGGGNFISFPKEVRPDGEQTAWDICYPVSAEFRTYLSDTILERYEWIMNREKV